MAKRKNKKPAHKTVRNWNAVSAHFNSGAGKHGDRRIKRQKTRKARDRKAIHDGW